MNTAPIFNKIELMPEALQERVSEYVDFLIQRHEVQEPLSKQEVTELRRRVDEYEKNPDSAMSVEELTQKIMQKYGE